MLVRDDNIPRSCPVSAPLLVFLITNSTADFLKVKYCCIGQVLTSPPEVGNDRRMSTLASKTRTRNESGKTRNLGLIPLMAYYSRPAAASQRRIKDREKGVRRLRKLIQTRQVQEILHA
jgi:hypothetical protein